MYLAFYTREHSCVPQSGAQMCSQDVSERMLGTFLSTENVFSVEERSDIGGGGFVALLHEIGRKTCRKRDKQGGNRLGLFTRKKKDNAPENRPVPRHIAVIMDGNGRWAKKRGLPRKAGHKVGAETFRTIATYCKDIGVQYFTVYAFSTENWKRPQDEVDALMNLFRSYLKEAAETMFERGVAVRVLGDLTMNHIVPIASRYEAMLLDKVYKMAQIGGLDASADIDLLKKIQGHTAAIQTLTIEMIEARKKANRIENARAKAIAYHDTVEVYFEEIRRHIDKLEEIIDDQMWTLPKYRELLFIK